MKGCSYNFVADWARDGGSLDSPSVLLQPFVNLLAKSDADIAKIKSHQVKSSEIGSNQARKRQNRSEQVKINRIVKILINLKLYCYLYFYQFSLIFS